MPKSSFVFALLASLAQGAAMAQSPTITVEVSGVAEAKGYILVAAFDKAEGWLKRPAQAARADAKAGTVTVTLPGLADGEYAFSVVHDLNGNNRLDANALGIPSEPYGFSNDAAGNFGPPKFEDARVKVGKDATKFVVKLN
ncbi:MAG: DUF2141 domain-containing protein [Betaproteobacteria bacterium]|nr:DUF2141 domain-containing protein [Betaproteobacteria bacterium]